MLSSMLIYTCQEENTSNKKKRMVIKMMYDYEISVASECGASFEDMLALAGVSAKEFEEA